MVKFHYEEGIASRLDLKPCAAAREGRREASAEAYIGQPLSRDSHIQGADGVSVSEGNTLACAIASARAALRGQRPWHVYKLLAREPGGLAIGHKPALVRIGKTMSRSR